MKKLFPVFVSTLVIACSGNPSGTFVAPENPELTIRNFMTAVQSNNLPAMSQLWGTKDGPATRTMNADEARKRLSVMQVYLRHDSYEVTPSFERLSDGRSEVFDVRIMRDQCTPVVPFTVVRAGNGWLIQGIDLTQAGNPARPCGQSSPTLLRPAGTRLPPSAF